MSSSASSRAFNLQDKLLSSALKVDRHDGPKDLLSLGKQTNNSTELTIHTSTWWVESKGKLYKSLNITGDSLYVPKGRE
jgi:hypothetical protein